MNFADDSSQERPESVRRNLTANFASLGYVLAVSVLVMPLYLRQLGAEAYGLIGFYALLSAVFQVLDFGLSATFVRECARYRGGAISAADLRGLHRALELIFATVACAAALAILGFAQVFAADWLQARQLSAREVATAVSLMGLALPFQWVCGLYRSALVGLERQVWLAVFNIVIATFRYLGVLVALHAYGPTPRVFFLYQAAVAFLEFAVLFVVSRRLLPKADPSAAHVSHWRSLAGVLHFSASVGVAVLCWIALTQGDRLILSRVLSLADYGVFTLAVTASGALIMASAPMSQALLPRLTKLNAEGGSDAAIALYRQATQLACLVALPASIVLTVFARPILGVWTGDGVLAAQAAPILASYAIGSGIITLAAFPYYLQYSRGDLRLHLLGQGLLVALLLPALLFASLRFGAVGAGLAWTGLNAAYFLAWTPVVHRRFAPGLHVSWLLQDIAPIALAAAGTALLLSRLVAWSPSRLEGLAQTILVTVAVCLAAGLASSAARVWLSKLIARLHPFSARPH